MRAEQGHLYYVGVQPYECGLKGKGAKTPTGVDVDAAGMYSFCLKPAEHQP